MYANVPLKKHFLLSVYFFINLNVLPDNDPDSEDARRMVHRNQMKSGEEVDPTQPPQYILLFVIYA